MFLFMRRNDFPFFENDFFWGGRGFLFGGNSLGTLSGRRRVWLRSDPLPKFLLLAFRQGHPSLQNYLVQLPALKSS